MKYPVIRIESNRPDKYGKSHYGETGEGVVVPDDPDTVWVSVGGIAIGAWPVSETNIKALETARELSETYEETSYEALIMKLVGQGVDPNSIKIAEDETVALVSNDGRYLRLPSREEAKLAWEELVQKGMVMQDE